HGRGPVDEPPDDDVGPEVPGRPAAQRPPAFEDRLSGRQAEAAGAFDEDDLEDDADDDRPQQPVPELAPGDQGRDHGGGADTRGRDDQPGPDDLPLGRARGLFGPGHGSRIGGVAGTRTVWSVNALAHAASLSSSAADSSAVAALDCRF